MRDVMPSGSRASLAATAFGLNMAWEVAHWPLYQCPWSPWVIARAAAFDAAVTVPAAEIVSLAPRRWRGEATLALALCGAALAIEVLALRRGRRFYRSAMPTIAGVGVTPLAQLPLLGTVAIKVIRRSGSAFT